MSQTLGQYRIGISFNPGGSGEVDDLKMKAAALIDTIDEMTNTSQNPEVKRLAALAMTHFEEGAMCAVKAVTKPPR